MLLLLFKKYFKKHSNIVSEYYIEKLTQGSRSAGKCFIYIEIGLTTMTKFSQFHQRKRFDAILLD